MLAKIATALLAVLIAAELAFIAGFAWWWWTFAHA